MPGYLQNPRNFWHAVRVCADILRGGTPEIAANGEYASFLCSVVNGELTCDDRNFLGGVCGVGQAAKNVDGYFQPPPLLVGSRNSLLYAVAP